MAARVDIDYRRADPVLDPARSARVFKHLSIGKGDIDEGFRQADVVVEGEYRTGHQEHLYIEPNGMLAIPGDGGITVVGSLQCPYYVHRALAVLLGLPEGKVRVVQAETGGGFGGKEEYPSMIAGHACLLALKSGRPVKLVYDRARGHARHHQAPPVGGPASHRRDARRPSHGDGHRRADGRRRLLHAQPGRPVARVPARHRSLSLRPRARQRPRRHDEHAAERRVPRVRRAADAVCRRGADGARRRSVGHGPGAPPRVERPPVRRYDRHGPGARRRHGRARRAPRRRRAQRLPAQAARVPRHQPRHRPVAVLPRGGVHRQRRGEAAVEGFAGTDARRRAHPRGQHGDRPGPAHGPRPDRGRCARPPLRRRRGRRRRHLAGAGQRAHGRVTNDDGGGGTAEAVRVGDARGSWAGCRRARTCARTARWSSRSSTSRRQAWSGTTRPIAGPRTARTAGRAT